MRILGKIESLNGLALPCDKCKRNLETGDEVKITFAEKDVLGWNCRVVRHKECEV